MIGLGLVKSLYFVQSCYSIVSNYWYSLTIIVEGWHKYRPMQEYENEWHFRPVIYLILFFYCWQSIGPSIYISLVGLFHAIFIRLPEIALTLPVNVLVTVKG